MTSSAPRASTYTLPVPDDSLRYVRELTEDARGSTNDAAYVRAISAPVAAAVVRDIRDELERYFAAQGEGHRVDIYRWLNNRADEIDGGAS